MIYGHDVIRVLKQRDNIRWVVQSAEGVDLVAIPWRLVYDQTEIVTTPSRRGRTKYDPDKLLALEACVLMAPLDADDLRELDRKQPGLTSKTAWRVERRQMDWVPVQEQEPQPPNRYSEEPTKPAKPVTQEDPQRKLLF